MGAIAGAAFVLGRQAVTDATAALTAAAAPAVLLWVRKVPEPLLILAAGAAGLALSH